MKVLQRKRILVVDDETSFTRPLKLNIERQDGCEGRVEAQADRAVAATREFRPDVILEAEAEVWGAVLPDDLRDWLEPGRIERIIAGVTASLSGSELGFDPAERDSGLVSIRALLGLLLYAYATGCYSSPDIAANLWPVFGGRAHRDGQTLDWRRLVWFRRSRRAVLLRCLEQVFRVAWQGRQGGVSFAEPLIKEEVESRFRWAAQLDSMALDE